MRGSATLNLGNACTLGEISPAIILKMPRSHHSRELVEIFFESVEDSFSRLFADSSWKVRQDLGAAFMKDGLKGIRPEELPEDSFFWAEVDFTRGSELVRVTYGDREFDINTIVETDHHENGARHFALWEFAEALGIDSVVPLSGAWVFEPTEIQRIVQGMGSFFAEHSNDILDPRPDVLQRLVAGRIERQAGWEVEAREADIRRASVKAAEAFRGKDYKTVVDILLPYETWLTPAQAKKLAYARTHAAEA